MMQRERPSKAQCHEVQDNRLENTLTTHKEEYQPWNESPEALRKRRNARWGKGAMEKLPIPEDMPVRYKFYFNTLIEWHFVTPEEIITTRKQLGPIIWNKKKLCLITQRKIAAFVYYKRDKPSTFRHESVRDPTSAYHWLLKNWDLTPYAGERGRPPKMEDDMKNVDAKGGKKPVPRRRA